MKKILFLLLLFPSLSLYSQTDSIGVYIKSNHTIRKIIPTRCIKAKHNEIGSAATIGFASAKMKVVYKGASSRNIATPTSEFYFYFPTQKNKLDEILSINPTLNVNGNPSNFGLARLKSRKDRNKRELIFRHINIYGGDMAGIDENPMALQTTEIKEGLYKVTFKKGMSCGEYAFVYLTENGAGAFMPVYDFCIK